MSRAIEERFKGAARTMRVVCSRCGASEQMNMHRDRALPPSMIIKKFTRSGWRLDGNPKNDVCKSCKRKPVQSRLPMAEKALHDIRSPMVANGKMHFSELEAICRTLGPEEARALIVILRERLPIKPKPEPRAARAAPIYDDGDYAEWLEHQEGNAA